MTSNICATGDNKDAMHMPDTGARLAQPWRWLWRSGLLLLILWGAAQMLAAQTLPAAAAGWQTKVAPSVLATAMDQETEFILFLVEQADVTAAAARPTRLARGFYVFARLRAVAERTQRPLLATLESHQAAYRPYWVANMIWVRGDWRVLAAAAQHDEVAYVYANARLPLSEPPPPPAVSQPQGIEWNIGLIGAPQVWAAGIAGQNIVIGGQDTGYDWNHPALINQYRGWDGQQADHSYNWHDAIHSGGGVCGVDSAEPCDDYGHGTHTLGILVGDDGQGNQIGVAPAARWIGCRNMDQGIGTPASYSECFQWFIAPTDAQGQNPDPARAPHIINNSWACTPGEGCLDPLILQTVVANTRAAGILVVASAGNSGASCSSISTPPAIYDDAFTVGAVTSSDVIAAYSSRGPVLSDGSNRLKPDVVAPGSNVRSSWLNGSYANLSGTSMAAPHVAGLAALILSANPNLIGQVSAVEDLILTTALPRASSEECGGVPGSQQPNNTYGYGRIDAYAAVTAAQARLGPYASYAGVIFRP